MSLNPSGVNYSWNYSNPNREGYSLELTGTIVTMQEVQAREYIPGNGVMGKPKYFNNGDPMMNVRIGFALEDGSFKTLTMTKASKAARAGLKPSLHWSLYLLSGNNFDNLLGKTVHLVTYPANPETGEPWGQGNPRRFDVELINDKTFALGVTIPAEFSVPELYANEAASGGAVIQQMPQQIPQIMPQQMPQMYQQYQPQMQGQFYAAPQAMPQQMPQQMPPVTQMYPPQQMPQQMSMQMPQGMDPQVAAAMQSMNVTNVQPVEGVYNDIPF